MKVDESLRIEKVTAFCHFNFISNILINNSISNYFLRFKWSAELMFWNWFGHITIRLTTPHLAEIYSSSGTNFTHLDGQQHCIHAHHNRPTGFRPNLARPNKHNNPRPSPSFWPLYISNSTISVQYITRKQRRFTIFILKRPFCFYWACAKFPFPVSCAEFFSVVWYRKLSNILLYGIWVDVYCV